MRRIVNFIPKLKIITLFIYLIPNIIAILFNLSEGKMELTNSIDTVLYIVGFIAFFNFIFTKKKVLTICLGRHFFHSNYMGHIFFFCYISYVF